MSCEFETARLKRDTGPGQNRRAQGPMSSREVELGLGFHSRMDRVAAELFLNTGLS